MPDSFSAIATTLTSPTSSQPSFLFKEATKEESDDPTQASVIEQLFGAKMQTHVQCNGCGHSWDVGRTELLHSLCYPHRATSGVCVCVTMIPHNPTLPPGPGSSSCEEDGGVSFGSVLEHSLCRQQCLQAWCEQCVKYKPTVSPGLLK